MEFVNSYEDVTRAKSYSKLEFANTYHLAFRDLPEIYRVRRKGAAALDFGCGTGRSTRFLRDLGFETIGVDISPEMVSKAKEIDPLGDYRVIPGDDMSSLPRESFNVIQSAFTFDNIPGKEVKHRLFSGLRQLLRPDGVFVSIVSTPEIYLNEWASFSTREFPENRNAKAGDIVKIITTDFEDRSPCLDILCPHESYLELFAGAGLRIVEHRKPLAMGNEPYGWVSETKIAPWSIYVVRRDEA